MTIRFPKMHIATSVSNRILNIADGLPSAVPEISPVPVLPDVTTQGQVLDAKLITPPEQTELPAGADGDVVAAALSGESLTDAAIAPVLGVE